MWRKLFSTFKKGSRILESKVSRTQENDILERLHAVTHSFPFKEDNFAWSPKQTKLHWNVFFVTDYSPFQKIIRLWWRSCTESFNYWINCRCNQLQCTDQGAKKVGFTACHSGKLLLVCTSPRVFLTSPKNFLMSSTDYSSSVIWISQKHFTCPSS